MGQASLKSCWVNFLHLTKQVKNNHLKILQWVELLKALKKTVCVNYCMQENANYAILGIMDTILKIRPSARETSYE